MTTEVLAGVFATRLSVISVRPTRAMTQAAILGFCGSLLICMASFRLGALSSTGTSSFANMMRGNAGTTLFMSSALIIGVLLCLQAWLQVGLSLSRQTITDVSQLWLILTSWCVPLLLSAPLFSRDVYSYVAQGKLVLAGINPYMHGPSSWSTWRADGVDPLWADSPSPYGQGFMLLGKGIAWITGTNVFFGAVGFRVLAIVGVGLLAWAVPVLAKSAGVDPAKALWLGVLNPLVLFHFVSAAHNDALMVGLIAAGLALVLRRQPLLGVLLVCLAGSIKPVGLLALPLVAFIWLGAERPTQRLLQRWLVSGVVLVAVMALLASITNTGLSWVAAMATPVQVLSWISPATVIGAGIAKVLEVSGLHVDNAINIVRAVITLIGVVLLIRLYLRPLGRSPIRAIAVAFLIAAVLGPVTQPWYLLWCLPLFAVCELSKLEDRVIVVGTITFTFVVLVSQFLDGAGYLPLA